MDQVEGRRWLGELRRRDREDTHGFLGPGSALGLSKAEDLVSYTERRHTSHSPHDGLLSAVREDSAWPTQSPSADALLEGVPDAGLQLVAVSHQPTSLPYPGVFAQFMLADYVARRLEKPSAVLWICLDADDAYDRRIRTSHLPISSARGGSIPLSSSLGSRPGYSQAQCYCPTPDLARQLKSWIESIRGATARLARDHELLEKELYEAKSLQIERLTKAFDGANQPSSFAALNSHLLLWFLRDVLDIPLLVVRLTTLVRHGREEMARTIERWPEVRSVASAAVHRAEMEGIRIRLGKGQLRNPGWAICSSCGRRHPQTPVALMKLLQEAHPRVNCPCGDDPIAAIAPGVLVEDLLQIALVQPVLMLTYAGGTSHALLAEHNAPAVLGEASPIYSWHPQQRLGTATERAASVEWERHRADRARAALELAVGGRDSLAHSLLVPEPKAIRRGWEKHFASGSLVDRMDLGGVAS
ncbi:MAG: hypothetical protein GY788_06660 [bacterium]|nr:hypothetical protein [bacterium]